MSGLQVAKLHAAVVGASISSGVLQTTLRTSVAHHALLGYLRSLGISIARHEDQSGPEEQRRIRRLRSSSDALSRVLATYSPWRTALKERRKAERAAKVKARQARKAGLNDALQAIEVTGVPAESGIVPLATGAPEHPNEAQ